MKDDKTSATALLIARSQLMLSNHPSLGWAVGPERARIYGEVVAATGCGGSRIALALAQATGVPGIYLHYALRKLRLEQIVRDHLARTSLKQVVVIAAGFDPLATLLHHEYPHLKWIEVDHPATQRYKNAALDKLGAGSNLALMPVDLVRAPIFSLFSHGGIEHEATLVIAEGITMYLTDSQIDRLFQDIRKGTQPRSSTLLFTYMNCRAGGSIDFECTTPLAKAWLAVKREKFVWGIEASELAAFVAARGYRLVGHWDSEAQCRDYLAGRGLGDRRLARGENIALIQSEA